MILETERLYLREMGPSDFDGLCGIMCDEETMRAAYNSPFTGAEVQGWLERQQARYRQTGFGLWAVVRRDTREMIGQCGLTLQYAFTALNADEVHSIIRDIHTASQHVALRCGMAVTDQCVKRFRDEDMRFYLYTAKRAEGSGTDTIRR